MVTTHQQATELLYMTDQAKDEQVVTVIGAGTDQFGQYIVFDKTIYYPQGGGQPGDKATMISSQGTKHEITSAKFTENGQVRHYVHPAMPSKAQEGRALIKIDALLRRIHSGYHTIGHLIVQILMEDLGFPNIKPRKAYHFPGEAYVEIQSGGEVITEEVVPEIYRMLAINRKAKLKVKQQIVSSVSEVPTGALVPKNFKPLVGKPLRLVTIEGYKAIPCGGTHVGSLSEIQGVYDISFKKKSGNLRIRYKCEIR